MSEVEGQLKVTSSPCELLNITPSAGITADKLVTIARRLDALPPRHEINLHDAIKKLAPSIKKMQARGHSLNAIAAELTASGLRIAPRTLARHLGKPKAHQVTP